MENVEVYRENIEGMEIERLVRDYEFNMQVRHFHASYELYYLVKGERYYFIDKQTYLIHAGTLVLVDKNQVHKTGMSNTSYHERILIQLSGEFFQTYLALAGFDLESFMSEHYGIMELNEREQPKIMAMFDAIAAELKDRQTGYEFIVRSRMVELLLLIKRHVKANLSFKGKVQTAQTARHRKVDEVADYLTTHYREGESLDALAKRFFVNKCYLSRIFKEVTGFTVGEYISIQRIKKAQELLIHTDYNITEIAEQLGYESITYFEKIFKRYNGISPLKYRKAEGG